MDDQVISQILILNKQEDLKTYFEDECLLKEHGGTSDYEYNPYEEYGFPREN